MSEPAGPPRREDLRSGGNDAHYRPVLLGVLLVVNAAAASWLAWQMGRQEAFCGLCLPVVAAAPYLAAAVFSFHRVNQFWFGLAKGLALTGPPAWAIVGVLFVASAVGPRPNKVVAAALLSVTFLIILGFHAAVFVLARRAAIRMLGFSSAAHTVAGLGATWLWWLLFALLV
jgi:hypothetical protein